jgi:hypothetical protein
MLKAFIINQMVDQALNELKTNKEILIGLAVQQSILRAPTSSLSLVKGDTLDERTLNYKRLVESILVAAADEVLADPNKVKEWVKSQI